ncbi:bifunctional 4-hydroxy-2-oxoglutarate aldolase/2-dehydro-3-deoxy-phosphogluconate aldolase [Glutamicibacter sp. NPDC087344]|uniref:bifunctional 4-hydroxy-2-oxoglutarate aldolase/2-dehydro-3-deoxy-phosphogluconate aldolase n=1 Tax=Glutamicibacter sp. NPDC087344 TaxID=3363994 RepID=UPI0038283359
MSTQLSNAIQRVPVPELLSANPVVAVLRAAHASEYAPVIEALVAGGVNNIELTLSTRGVFELLAEICEQFDGRAQIGVGTVTTAPEARQAIASGARFIVTPVTDPEIVDACVQAGIPVFPGGLTPTELHRGWAAGASAVKVFPASQVGAGYLKDLRGPFPQIQVIPSGGVGVAEAIEWIKAGAVAVSVGGPLVGDAFKGGDLSALTERARTLQLAVRAARDEAVSAGN